MGLIIGHETVAEPGRPTDFNMRRRQALIDTGELEFPTSSYAQPGRLLYTDVTITECRADHELLGWNVTAWRNGYSCQFRSFGSSTTGALNSGLLWVRWSCAVQYLSPATYEAIMSDESL